MMWSRPAKTPDTPTDNTVGYKKPLLSFVGRFLDSTDVAEFFRPFRTARAKFVLVKPELDRIYFRFGDGTLAAYQLSTFFQRLESGEALDFFSPVGRETRGGNPEKWLRWGAYWNPEIGGAGWLTYNIDGALRFTSFDVDDQGYVYAAATMFGWGILHDDLSNYGSMLLSLIQKRSVQPATIAAVKGATKYYAILGTRQMYDVTDRRNPIALPANNVPGLKAFAKSSTHVAIVDDYRNLTIATADQFATGQAPAVSIPSGFKSVASDGTKFYALRDTAEGVSIVVCSSSEFISETQTGFQPDTIHYGDGFLVLSGVSDGSWDMRVWRTDLSPITMEATPADPSHPSYFRNYYGMAPAGYAAPDNINLFDGTVYRAPNGRTFLIVCAKGLGDVYEFAPGAAVTPPPPPPPVPTPVPPPVIDPGPPAPPPPPPSAQSGSIAMNFAVFSTRVEADARAAQVGGRVAKSGNQFVTFWF